MRCILTIALVALALGAGSFAAREMTVAAQGQRVLETRTDVTPDKTGLENLVTPMRSEQKIVDRLGMKSVMFSTATEAPGSENLRLTLSHENCEIATENWNEFGKDAEWGELRKTAAPTGQLKITSQFMTPTDFSPVK